VTQLQKPGRRLLADGLSRSWFELNRMSGAMAQGLAGPEYGIEDGLRAALDLLDWHENHPQFAGPGAYFSAPADLMGGGGEVLASINPRTTIIAEALLSLKDKPTEIKRLFQEVATNAIQAGDLLNPPRHLLLVMTQRVERSVKPEKRALGIDLDAELAKALQGGTD
jgi:hypothetical protein